MLQYKTIAPNTLELLKNLSTEELFSGLRLVGGTALALQYGHRNSIDLDFFGRIEADSDSIIELLKAYGELQIYKVSKNINIFAINGIKVDIVNYKYPWIDKPIVEDGLFLASPKDIAAMKINAIEGRGSKKDFIDVNELLKHFTLQQILDFHSKKYSNASTLRSIMSLSYFDDAEEQPMPKMFTSDTWEEIKKNISRIISVYGK